MSRCPALDITDESRLAYELFVLAHERQPQRGGYELYRRTLTFSELLNLPHWLVEAFRAVENELYQIQSERFTNA